MTHPFDEDFVGTLQSVEPTTKVRVVANLAISERDAVDASMATLTPDKFASREDYRRERTRINESRVAATTLAARSRLEELGVSVKSGNLSRTAVLEGAAAALAQGIEEGLISEAHIDRDFQAI